MSELSLTIIRVAFLAVLWLFVIAAIGVVRTDLLGGPATSSRRSRARQAQSLRPPARAAKPQRPGQAPAARLSERPERQPGARQRLAYLPCQRHRARRIAVQAHRVDRQ